MHTTINVLKEGLMSLRRGSKRNQHYIDMDGYKCFYEQIGSRKRV